MLLILNDLPLKVNEHFLNWQVAISLLVINLSNQIVFNE